MKPNYRAAASVGLLLTACTHVGQGATTVTSVGPQAASSNFDVLFSTTILSATQLVSISDGSVFTGEGANLSISAVLTDDQVVQIFSLTPGNIFTNESLSALTGNSFTPFASPKDVKALRFRSTGGAFAGTFALPAATLLTFTVVPEPVSALLALLGCVFLAFARRRVAA